MKTSMISSLLALLGCPTLLLVQTFSRQEARGVKPLPSFIYEIERAAPHDEAQFELRDCLLRKLFPPAAFDRLVEPGRLLPDRRQNDRLLAAKFSRNRPTFSPSPAHLHGGVHEAWVSQCASGIAPGYEYAEAIALDRAGNVYIAGSSYRAEEPGTDYATIKYNANGVEQWAAHFDGSHGHDNPTGLALDLSGMQSAGEYRMQWHPRNLPSGVYFYRLQVEELSGVGDFVETKKLVLIAPGASDE